MKNFIMGILFISICSPILDSLVNLVVQAIQLLRAKLILSICKINKQIEEQGGEVEEKEQTKHYGFYQLPEPQQLVSEEEEEYDDD